MGKHANVFVTPEGHRLIDVMPPEALTQLLLQGCLQRDKGGLNEEGWLEMGFPFTAPLSLDSSGNVYCVNCHQKFVGVKCLSSSVFTRFQQGDGAFNVAIAYVYDILRLHDIPFDEERYEAWLRATGFSNR